MAAEFCFHRIEGPGAGAAAPCPCPHCKSSLGAAVWLHSGTLTESIGMSDKPTGIANGLTNYGDRDFSLYLRRSFAQSMGYSRAMLAKPVVGIAYTASGF